MKSPEHCDFCRPEDLEWRTVTSHDLFRSFVPNPRFREGHCLVIPNRHIEQPGELNETEVSLILLELGRLSVRLDGGYGTGIMQKFQPLQSENGIKVNHLHFHVFPRIEHEDGLFPVPEPNNFNGFKAAPKYEIANLAESLK